METRPGNNLSDMILLRHVQSDKNEMICCCFQFSYVTLYAIIGVLCFLNLKLSAEEAYAVLFRQNEMQTCFSMYTLHSEKLNMAT